MDDILQKLIYPLPVKSADYRWRLSVFFIQDTYPLLHLRHIFLAQEQGNIFDYYSLPLRFNFKNRMEQQEFKHAVKIQVRFNDVDMMGHVSNTVYQSYYDYGKLKYIETVLGDIQWDKCSIVGASIKIDYLQPIFMKTQILVQTRVAAIGNKSMTFEHRIIKRDTEEILSTCTAIVVCYKPLEHLSIPVPEEWKNKIHTFEGIEPYFNGK